MGSNIGPHVPDDDPIETIMVHPVTFAPAVQFTKLCYLCQVLICISILISIRIRCSDCTAHCI